jgi:hypothetical protein
METELGVPPPPKDATPIPTDKPGKFTPPKRPTPKTRTSQPTATTTSVPKPKADPKHKPPAQVKAKYPDDPEVTALALTYCGAETAKNSEHMLAMVNLFIDDLRLGKVPEQLWPSTKYLKKIGYELRDIRLIREEYLLSIRGEEVETTANGLPLNAKQKVEAAEKKARISELKKARENIGISSRPEDSKGSGVISSLMNMVPFGILQGVGGDLDELLSSGKTYEREQKEDRDLKAKLRLEGVDVEADDIKASMNDNASRIISDTAGEYEEDAARAEKYDKWKERGKKVGGLLSPLKSINNSTTDAKQTVINSTRNTELSNSTVTNSPSVTNFANVSTTRRSLNAKNAEVAAQNTNTTNNIVNSARSIDPVGGLTIAPSMLTPNSSADESTMEGALSPKDKSVTILGKIESGVTKMVELLSSSQDQGVETAKEEGGVIGDVVSAAVETVGSGLITKLAPVLAVGAAGAAGVAVGTVANAGINMATKSLTDGKYGSVGEAIAGDDPKLSKAIDLKEVNAERAKSGRLPMTASEFEAKTNPTKAQDVQSVSSQMTPAAKDITPTPHKNAVLQQGIEHAQDKAIRLEAAAEAKKAAPAAPSATTNNSTINNQSTTSLSIRAQPKNNDSPWNRYQDSRYQ